MKPVAYDPCRPLRYVVNNATAPPGADALVAEALATMSAVTGLQFEAEGATDEAPSSERRPFQPDRYGDRWAPILIAWSDDVAVPQLQGDVLGIGGSAFVQYPGAPVVNVTGMVALDGPQLAQALAVPEGIAPSGPRSSTSSPTSWA